MTRAPTATPGKEGKKKKTVTAHEIKGKCQSLSPVQLFMTPWSVVHQAPVHGVLQARILCPKMVPKHSDVSFGVVTLDKVTFLWHLTAKQ